MTCLDVWIFVLKIDQITKSVNKKNQEKEPGESIGRIILSMMDLNFCVLVTVGY